MKILKIVALSLVGLMMSSCIKEKVNFAHQESLKLYEKMCNLTQSYIDSIEAAKDSTQINSLIDRYEASVDKLNYEVTPDTDYLLTEGQNDTILLLMLRLSDIRDERLHSFRNGGSQNSAETDSLPSKGAEAA